MKKILVFLTSVFIVGLIAISPSTLNNNQGSFSLDINYVDAQLVAPDTNWVAGQAPSTTVPYVAPKTSTETLPSSSPNTDLKIGRLGCNTYEFGCQLMEWVVIDVFVFIGNIALAMSGWFLDWFLQFSLESSSYKDAGFILQGWEILRDITNIVFIFVLLFIAFKMVLGVDNAGAKDQLVKTILMTLAINFSLFISFFIIDIGNLLAYTFYSRIEAPLVDFNSSVVEGNVELMDSVTSTKTPSVSLAIADQFKPQRILLGVGNDYLGKGEKIIMGVVIGVVNFTAAYVFLSVAFLFLGRTIGLYISTMLSALAFATIALPAAKDIPYIGFQGWFSEHLKLSFMAPVFLFFLYMSIQFMNIGLLQGATRGSFLQDLLSVLIPLAASVTILLLAKDIAQKMAGKLGTQASEIVSKGVGLTVAGGTLVASGVASAGLSVAGRLTQATGKVFKSEKTIKAGESLRNASTVAGSMKFDYSKIPGFKMVLGDKAQKFTEKISNRSVLGHISQKKTEIQKGSPFVELEYDKLAKEKIARERERESRNRDKSKSASDWQKEVEKTQREGEERVIDTQSSEKIIDEENKILNKESTNTRDTNPATGKIFTEKEFIQALHEEFSKGLIVSVGAPERGDYTDSTGFVVSRDFVKTDSTGATVNASRVEFENNELKKYELALKKQESELLNVRAAGISTDIATEQGKLDTIEAELSTFKKQTGKAKQEKAEDIQKNVRGRSRETVASGYESQPGLSAKKQKEAQGAANRIRSGKVKVEENQDISK